MNELAIDGQSGFINSFERLLGPQEDKERLNPYKECAALIERRESEGHKLDSQCRQMIFSHKITAEVHLYNHLSVELADVELTTVLIV